LKKRRAGGAETSTAQFKKVFCFFFPKKKRFLALVFPLRQPERISRVSPKNFDLGGEEFQLLQRQP
jgi:hypothetical protein